jgi:arylsulfatase A-like enzyme
MKVNKLLSLLLLFALSEAYGQKTAPAKKPNIVYILTDQWRASAFGYTGDPNVKTPQIDKFAKEAVNFKNMVSVAPVCTPYRASIQTGRYPTTTGMFLNDVYLPSEELCMAEIFKANGYNTAYFGKWHLDGHGRKDNVAPERRQGFDFWKGSECDHNYNNEHYYANNDPEIKYWQGYSTFAIAEEAQRYMEDNTKADKPFLLFVSIGTPHFPHETAPQEYKDMYPKEKLKLNANVPEGIKEKTLKELQGYYAHCSATDKAVGEIIEKSKKLGIFDNTIIVFTSDHGEMMGAHGHQPTQKQAVYAESSEVPFLISYPQIGKNKGTIAEAPMTTPDILPSLLGMCRIAIPKTIEGYDLSNVMKSPSKQKDRVALYMSICPFTSLIHFEEFYAIKTARYTYSKTPKGENLLFDNQKDPLQMNNLWADAQHAKVVTKLDQLLMKELSRIGVDSIKPKDFYLKKFGYYGVPEFDKFYAVKDYHKVEKVISPKVQK